jgi:hypothetical protein
LNRLEHRRHGLVYRRQGSYANLNRLEHELVVTNYSGLCRYRVGDMLRVAVFHDAAAWFQFLRNTNMVLSVDSENTDKADLQHAVDRTARRRGRAGLHQPGVHGELPGALRGLLGAADADQQGR